MLLVPTRRRLKKLRNFCDSASVAETTCAAMIIVDKKDYLDNEKEYLELEVDHFPNKDWKIHITESVGMGPKVREVWDRLKGASWVGILNDDHYIVTKHWDQRLIRQLDGKNFITCNDRWNAPVRAAGATMFSMPLMEAFGFPMFPKQIDHLGIDDVFEQIGRQTGCWEVDMSVIIEHHHILKNPDAMDETHKIVYGTKPWTEAPEAKAAQASFIEWYTKDFPSVIERVRALRADERLKEMPRKTEFIEATT